MPKIEKSHHRPWIPERTPFFRYSGNNAAFYHSVAWRNARSVQLTEHPLCQECEKKGIITPATLVDHIKPINEGGSKLDPHNLQSLCDKCHNKKSAREGNR